MAKLGLDEIGLVRLVTRGSLRFSRGSGLFYGCGYRIADCGFARVGILGRRIDRIVRA